MNLNEENREERKFTGLPSETRHNLIQNLIHNLFKSPWEGGMYERLIKDVKKTLHKTLDWTHLTFEQLVAVVIDVEKTFWATGPWPILTAMEGKNKF